MNVVNIIAFGSLALLVCTAAASKGCLDADGSSVDWFAALKVNNGYEYYYTTGSTWKSGGYLNTSSPTGPLGKTLLSIYSTSSSSGYVMYNDEYNGQHESNAHAKGVLSFDSEGGFWLVHSVPNFPPQISDRYSYPSPEAIYGQSFLCLSLNPSNISVVASLLQTDRVYVYDSSLPSSIGHDYPEVADLLNGNYVHGSATNATVIATKDHNQFYAFAKSGAWDNDLYEFLVQPYFRASMQWETWADGSPGPLPSFCPPTYKYESVNIQSINLSGHTWTVNQDHSKWGCGMKGSAPIVCIGDINRQASQYTRGGGTVCVDSTELYSAFSGIIASAQSC